jgi:membrane protein involved in colicin uptake
LGATPWTPLSDIKQNYRQLIRIFHPDRVLITQNTDNTDYAAMINIAYQKVSDKLQENRVNQSASAYEQDFPSNAQAPAEQNNVYFWRAIKTICKSKLDSMQNVISASYQLIVNFLKMFGLGVGFFKNQAIKIQNLIYKTVAILALNMKLMLLESCLFFWALIKKASLFIKFLAFKLFRFSKHNLESIRLLMYQSVEIFNSRKVIVKDLFSNYFNWLNTIVRNTTQNTFKTIKFNLLTIIGINLVFSILVALQTEWGQQQYLSANAIFKDQSKHLFATNINTKNINNPLIFERRLNLEDKRLADLEAKRLAELEAKRLAEVEAKRIAELEAKRLAEFEAKKQAAQEAKRLADLEAKRIAELEAKRIAELEAKRLAEVESKRLADLEAKRLAELEAKRIAALEAKRIAALEAKKKAAQEAKRLADLEAKRLAELEAKRLAELEAKKQAAQEVNPVAIRQEKNNDSNQDKKVMKNQSIKQQSKIESTLDIDYRVYIDD